MTAKLNAVTVAVNWRLAPREAAYIVNDAEATVLVAGEELLPLVEAIAPELTTVRKVVVVGGHPRYESYEVWLARQEITDPNEHAAGRHRRDAASRWLAADGRRRLPRR